MLGEFNIERVSHQKMVKEYARLEQRLSNLQDELNIERSSIENAAKQRVLAVVSGKLKSAQLVS